MKKVLREELEKQRKLMNLDEQGLNKSFADAVYDYVVGGLESIFSPDDEDEEVKSKPKNRRLSSWDQIADKIIDKIEGGYYHPIMLKGGRGYPRSTAMGDSGETMFGIDRKHAGRLNDTPEGIEFWNTIDKAEASKKWPWLYRGGSLEPKLKDLAIKMIKKNYDDFSKRYLSDGAIEIVNSDEGLSTHMGYATWNGPGWFRKFANSINAEVEQGVKDPKKLLRKGLSDRKNSSNRLISASAEKLEKILNTNLV